MSLLGLFGLVDLLCQLVWYFLAILLHSKEFSIGNKVQNKYPNEWDDPHFIISNESMEFVDSKGIEYGL